MCEIELLVLNRLNLVYVVLKKKKKFCVVVIGDGIYELYGWLVDMRSYNG